MAAPGARRSHVKTRTAWIQLLALLAGTFMTILDFFIVNVAVSTIETDLGASAGQLQLVVAGYGLAYASGVTIGGRIGDRFGRRRTFAVGLTAFVAASVGCGLSSTIEILIAGRIAQGAAAAVMAPQVLALLSVVFEPSLQGWAFNGYAICLGVASGSGQLLGGALISADAFGAGWRMCFLVNAPIGLVALSLVLVRVPESRSPSPPRLDVPSAGLAALTMVTLVLPLIIGREQGWPWWTWTLFGVAACASLVFRRRQFAVERAGRMPLVPVRLLLDRTFVFGCAMTIGFYSGVASYFLVLSLYLQQGLGYGPLESGVVFSVMVAGFLITTGNARRAVRWLGPWQLVAGCVVTGIGHLAMAPIVRGRSPALVAVVAGLLTVGAGMGLVMGPLIERVMRGTDPAEVGAASGVLTASQQLGNSLGVAVIGVVFFSVADQRGLLTATAASHWLLAALSGALAVGFCKLDVRRQPGDRLALPISRSIESTECRRDGPRTNAPESPAGDRTT